MFADEGHWSIFQIFKTTLYVIATNIIFLLLLPFLLLFIIFFAICHTIIDIYLRVKHGKLYGGLLVNGDAFWKAEDETKPIINVLAILNSDMNFDDTLNYTKRTMKEEMNSNPSRYSKYTSICKTTALGYGYLLKDQTCFEDCLTIVDPAEIPGDYVDEEYLTNFLSSYANAPLPVDHQALYQYIALSKPIRWNNDVKEANQFAVMMRFHHIFGDGFSIHGMFLTLFAKDKMEYLKSLQEFIKKIMRPPQGKTSIFGKLSEVLKKLGILLYLILMYAPTVMYQGIFRRADRNALHGPRLSGDKHLVYLVEKEEKLITKIRDIRKHLYGSSFSHVLLAAYSASMDKYFKKVSATSPKTMTTGITAVLKKPQIHGGRDNNFVFALMDTQINTGDISSMDRFKKIRKRFNTFTRTPQFPINNFMLNCCSGLFPAPVLKNIMKSDKFTSVMSIVPGLPDKLVGDGFVTQDIVFFVPHRGKQGIGLSVLTYNSRFQIGLSVDKVLIKNVEDVQFIADSFLEEINNLHQEVMGKLSKTNDIEISIL